eukprot:scaffold1051_cov254-Pinguiococcus_pyrenoidosus.AAC.8
MRIIHIALARRESGCFFQILARQLVGLFQDFATRTNRAASASARDTAPSRKRKSAVDRRRDSSEKLAAPHPRARLV